MIEIKFEDVEINSERWLDLKDLLNEEWRDIQGYEGRYEVSNYGRVKRLMKWSGNRFIDQGNILRRRINTCGYVHVLLCNREQKSKTVHRLVAQAFIPNIDKLPQVNHKDGNKQNNRVDNLEWCNNSQNIKHAYIMGLEKPNVLGKFGGNSPYHKEVLQIDKNDNSIIQKWESIADASRKLNINTSNISLCCKKLNRTAGGYKWRYANE